MLDSIFNFFRVNMDRSPAPDHPLLVPQPHSGKVNMRIWTPPPEKSTETSTAIRSLENVRDKLVSGTASRANTDGALARRGTPTRSSSASQAALKIQSGETGRRLDSPERRSDSVRKRRYTDDDQLRAALAEIKKENHTLTGQLFSTRNELAEALKKNQGNQQKMQKLLDEKSAILTELQSARQGWDAKERDFLRKIGELEVNNKKMDGSLRTVQAKLRSVEGKLQETTKLLEVRTADLSGVQTFLTTTDSYSGAEIIKMTESLNAEIFQAAAYMAELLEDNSMTATQTERDRNVDKYHGILIADVQHHIGESLWIYLQKNHITIRTDLLPLQLAFQSILAIWCAYCIRYFTMGPQAEFLENLYRRIHNSEAQPISGRWRAITSAKVAEIPGSRMSTDAIVDCLLGLLYFCGWSSSHEKSKKAMLSIQNRIFAMDKMASQLKLATKEGITTMDINAYVVRDGAPFTADMEDSYADSSLENVVSRPTTQRVLCTIGLGLRRSVGKRNEVGAVECQDDTLLKPKVALTSVLVDDSSSRRG